MRRPFLWSAFAGLLCFATARAWSAEPATVVHSTHVPPGYTLDWHDEFDGPLDSSKWAHFLVDRSRGWVRLSREAASNEVSGVLALSASEPEGGPVSAWLTTQPSYRRTFGYFEARIRTHSTRGLRSAFWLMSASLGMKPGQPGTSGAEIDILSYAGDGERDRALSQGAYWDSYEGTPRLGTNTLGQVRVLSNAPPPQASGAMIDLDSHGLTNVVPSADFHVYGLRWTEREYVFSVDGCETFRTWRGISRVSQFLCLSLLPPPGENERPSHTVLPARMRVDYVRVYAPPAGTNAPVAAPAPGPVEMHETLAPAPLSDALSTNTQPVEMSPAPDAPAEPPR